MSRSPPRPPLQLVQIVRVTITEDASGLLIAESADLPERTAFASDMATLNAEVRDIIEGYFAKRGLRVRVSRSPGRNRNDLSAWEVETIEGDADLSMAAE